MSYFKKLVLVTGDLVSHLTGFGAVRDWTPNARVGEVILDIPAYSQINSCCCGVVAGFQLVKAVDPLADFSDFYAEVEPDREFGTTARELIRALREFGVPMRQKMRLKLTDLKDSIDRGQPVIMVVQNRCSDSSHWVMVYGYGDRHVLLANNGVPWLPFRRRITWEHFKQIWLPKGNGLMCCHSRV